MARQEYLILFFLLITIGVCNSFWVDHRDRRMPPPVESFLEKLRDLSNQRFSRDVRGLDSHLSSEESKDHAEEKNNQDNNQDMISSLLNLRQKRYAPSVIFRGCHLGTCQIQNLANRLYLLGNNNNKEDSNRDTKDPLGYGRRRRRSLLYGKRRTDSAQTLQAT